MKVKIFISYAHDEYASMQILKKSLQNAGDGKIEIETDEQIVPGQEWDKQIRNSLDHSHIILFLISRKFILSRYIKEVELKNAIDRYDRGDVVLIPVILEKLEDGDSKEFPLNKFEPLPVENKKTKPVNDWGEEQHAIDNIVQGILRTVETILLSKPFNRTIIKKFQGYFVNQPDTIFSELQRMKPFLAAFDPMISNASLKLSAEWKENKNNIARATKGAKDERNDILNRLLDFITDLETKIDE